MKVYISRIPKYHSIRQKIPRCKVAADTRGLCSKSHQTHDLHVIILLEIDNWLLLHEICAFLHGSDDAVCGVKRSRTRDSRICSIIDTTLCVL